MALDIRRLSRDEEPMLEELLATDPTTNLFLLSFLAIHSIERAWWYGALDGERCIGAMLVIPQRLAVPYCPELNAADAIGSFVRETHTPSMMVGPRAATDAVWSQWSGGTPKVCFDQRLYANETQEEGDPFRDRPRGLRRGLATEWLEIAEQAAQMEEEDTGINPALHNLAEHQKGVKERVQSGRTWVIEEEGDLVFQVNVGTVSRMGCQIGGTWVPPQHRGRGLATQGVRTVTRWLLSRSPRVTLHVNEANLPAVRVYEKCGFQPLTPFRLLVA